jgi:uncharacterized small protein (TIGR04563 family)
MSEKHIKQDPRKISLYMPLEEQREVKEEAKRLGRPVSWILQRCWAFAREHIRKMPVQ